MAALLLTCCGMLSSRISKKRSARKQRDMEYSENFEVLKEENAKRMRHLSDAGVPGYENITGGVGASVVESSGLTRGSSWESSHQARHGGGSVETLGTVEERGGDGEGTGRPSAASGEMRMLPSYEDVVQGGRR